MTEMVSPATLAEAINLLRERPGLRPIAGCTDLMVGDAVQRSALGDALDLLAIPELAGIRKADASIDIGATTTFAEIGSAELIRDELPALAAAARVIGGWQIQNRATIGGNIVNASPAGDSLPVLLALEARAIVAGIDGRRELPLTSFYRGYRKTALRPGELLERLEIPLPPAATRQFFRKVGTREAQAISKVVVAVVGRVEEGAVTDFRLAAGSVAATPVRLSRVEQALLGRGCDPEVADLAERLARDSVEPIDDVRSTAAYRRFVLGRIVRRMTLDLMTG